jgi:hypothetical protein
MPGNIIELLQCWKSQGQGHSKEAIWKFIIAFLMWSILRETNRHHFEDRETALLCLKFLFLRSLLDWAVVYVPTFSSSNLFDLVNFLDSRRI